MKREYLEKEIEDFEKLGNRDVYGFYVTYNVSENSKSQKWGFIGEFDKVLSEIEACQTCIDGELPIERLIIFGNMSSGSSDCLVFSKNLLWDCVNDESELSHTEVVVPMIASDGTFGKIIPC